MPRILGENLLNTCIIDDQVSNSKIRFFYRLPTTEERAAHFSSLFKREGDKVEQRVSEARVEAGLKIVQGFADGDFHQKTADGQQRPISSDPSSANFEPMWKEFLAKYASDLLETLAIHVFETSRAMGSQAETYNEKK